MEVQVTTSEELSLFDYREIMPGVYAFPAGGRVLFVEPDDSAMLVIRPTRKPTRKRAAALSSSAPPDGMSDMNLEAAIKALL